jgi:hypothetical protein
MNQNNSGDDIFVAVASKKKSALKDTTQKQQAIPAKTCFISGHVDITAKQCGFLGLLTYHCYS